MVLIACLHVDRTFRPYNTTRPRNESRNKSGVIHAEKDDKSDGNYE